MGAADDPGCSGGAVLFVVGVKHEQQVEGVSQDGVDLVGRSPWQNIMERKLLV